MLRLSVSSSSLSRMMCRQTCPLRHGLESVRSNSPIATRYLSGTIRVRSRSCVSCTTRCYPSLARGQQAAQSGPGVAPTMEAEVISEVEAEAEAEEEQEQEQEQEQEKNQEQEEMVVQEAGKQSYSREDETVRPWSLRHLAEPPKTEQDLGGLLGGKTEPPFYPWGRFAVYRSGINKAKPLHWPSRLWISNNYFRSQWSLRTYRRLKNVICAMEWQPPSEAGSHAPQATVGIAGSVTLSEMQCDRVKSAFGYLDEDTDGMVTAAELATLGRAVDLESVAHFAGAADPTVGALPVEMVVPLVQEQLRSHAEGPGSRYWVLLSLAEAESLRGALHVRQERGGGRRERHERGRNGKALRSGCWRR